MGDEKYELHVVSQTHWDREWYLTFQQFRVRLVDLIDNLLDIMDGDPEYKYYTLDGQTVVLEDYLEIKPENRGRLENYIKAGKIFVGPWYILPDEFLVSAEATVRNLMLGHRIASEFGAVMKAGYIPDPFGHLSQLPQILQGFGIDNVILWRGFGGEPGQDKSEYHWESPDGSRVLMLHLPRMGYCNALKLPSDPGQSEARVKRIMEEVVPRATTRYLLLLNGVDHVEPQPDLSTIIRETNKRLDNAVLVHSNLIDYIQKIKEAQPQLTTEKGELRFGYKYAFLLNGVYSARMYIKQRNEECQTQLEKWAEPSCAFAWLLGKEYPSGLLWKSWRYLIRNHPHDSICGCSTDDVHKQMMTRFSWSKEIADELTDRSLNFTVNKIDTSDEETEDQNLVVFNPLGWECKDVVPAQLDFLMQSDSVMPDLTLGSDEEIKDHIYDKRVRGFIIKDEDGREVPYQVIDAKAYGKRFMRQYYFPRIIESACFNILLPVENVPACGYKTYRVIPEEQVKKFDSEVKVNDRVMENELLKVIVKDNGALTITDKRTGAVYDNCNSFEDSADVGDEYNYSYTLRDMIVSSLGFSSSISLAENGPLRATFKVRVELMLPKSATEDHKARGEELVACPITSYVSLSAGSGRVDIKTVFENNAEDHRIRALFPSGIETDYSYGEGQFDVVKRKIKRPDLNEYPIEEPIPTHPQQTFMDVNDGKKGLTIASKGLPEYEVKDDESRTIALTLLRGVGALSRGDLLTRGSGNAGWPTYTPGAQCLGEHTFYYSIIPHSGSWDSAKTYKQAHQHNIPCRVVQTGVHEGNLPKKLSFVSIEPDNLIISAIKKAEDDALIVRFYNTTDKEVEGKVKCYKPIKEASLTNLNEESIEKVEVEDSDTVRVKAKGWQVITLKFKF